MPPPGAVYRGSASASVVAPALASPPAAGETRDGTDQAEDGDMAEQLPRLKVAPTFLQNFKQAHPNAMSAWGDVIDNARDADATRLEIDFRRRQMHGGLQALVVLTDNGRGMSETEMSKGISGLGYTDKGLETGQHYGFGATTSLPRLSDCCLVLSVYAGEGTVCFLSTKLQAQLGPSQAVTPQCTWTTGGTMLQSRTAFLDTAKRRQSLATITKYTPFSSEEALLNELAELGSHGTRIILWGSIEEEHQLVRDDIRVCREAGEHLRWEHEYSLRSYLEVLYYCDAQVQPTMQISIGGSEVVPRDWTSFLNHRKDATPYYPQVDVRSNGGERAVARLSLGYQVQLKQLVAVFQSRDRDSNAHARKKELQEYSVRQSASNPRPTRARLELIGGSPHVAGDLLLSSWPPDHTLAGESEEEPKLLADDGHAHSSLW